MTDENTEPAEPTTVAEFLTLHKLEQYATAFEQEGWDDLNI